MISQQQSLNPWNPCHPCLDYSAMISNGREYLCWLCHNNIILIMINTEELQSQSHTLKWKSEMISHCRRPNYTSDPQAIDFPEPLLRCYSLSHIKICIKLGNYKIIHKKGKNHHKNWPVRLPSWLSCKQWPNFQNESKIDWLAENSSQNPTRVGARYRRTIKKPAKSKKQHKSSWRILNFW